MIQAALSLPRSSAQREAAHGTSLEIGALPDAGDTPYEARFPDKTVLWVEWKVVAVRLETEPAGLSEIAVFRAPWRRRLIPGNGAVLRV